MQQCRYASYTQDSQGNLWIYGGNSSQGSMNTLWKYNSSNNSWTWVSGSNWGDQSPIFGTKGVPSINNTPGSTSSSSMWVDSQDNIWVFGGAGMTGGGSNIAWNTLWKYNPSDDTWTWISGGNTANPRGSFGTKNITDPNNVPPNLYSSSYWKDSQNNVLIFGGFGLTGVGIDSIYNALWKYNPNDNTWTWISGSNTLNSRGSFGTQVIPSINNIPSGLAYQYMWVDNDGNMRIFGGYGLGETGTNNNWLSAMWQYNP